VDSEWKELSTKCIANRQECCKVLADADKYEFEFWNDSDPKTIYRGPLCGGHFYSCHPFIDFISLNHCRYRLKQNIPTHEEIMTKWWKNDGNWFRISSYNSETKVYVSINNFYKKEYFINLESAIIPPE
jgi:hypothetical protein